MNPMALSDDRLARFIQQVMALDRWNATVLDDGHADHLTIGPDPQGPYYLVDDVTRLIRDAEASPSDGTVVRRAMHE